MSAEVTESASLAIQYNVPSGQANLIAGIAGMSVRIPPGYQSLASLQAILAPRKREVEAPRDPDESEQTFLRLLRIENWFIGVGVAAVFVGATAVLVLRAGEPAHTVAAIIVAISVLGFLVAVGGFIVTNLKEDRAFDRLVPLAEISQLMDKHRWDEAISRLEVAQASPDIASQVQAWNLLAECYAATGRNAESEAMIRRSIDRTADTNNETLGQQLACLGVVVRRQGRLAEAEDLMAQALDRLRKRDPEATVFTLKNLAYLYWVSGQQDRAREIYERLPEHDPDQLEFVTQVLEPFAEPFLPASADIEPGSA